jgi:hypothetical protein
MPKRNRPAPVQHNRELNASSQTTTCPDCGLALRVDTTAFKFVYDMKDWRRVCTRVHLGDAAWCLVQRDGTNLLPPAMDGRERRNDVHVDC